MGYLVTFSVLFLLLSGIAVWLSYAPIHNVRDVAELAMSAIGLASSRVLWLAAYSIITVAVGNMIVEYLVVDRYKRGKSEGIREGVKGGTVKVAGLVRTPTGRPARRQAL